MIVLFIFLGMLGAAGLMILGRISFNLSHQWKRAVATGAALIVVTAAVGASGVPALDPQDVRMAQERTEELRDQGVNATIVFATEEEAAAIAIAAEDAGVVPAPSDDPQSVRVFQGPRAKISALAQKGNTSVPQTGLVGTIAEDPAHDPDPEW